MRLAAILAFGVLLLGMTASAENDPGADKLIVPNAKRKRIVPKADRGLPPDETLEEFAKLFIGYVTKIWPELQVSGLLPVDNPKTISEMVESYKQRHRRAIVNWDRIAAFQGVVANLGVMYPRYSYRKSQVKSIPDQAFQILQKGRTLDCFIPWEFVFGDYARSATRGHRQGFESLNSVLKQNGADIDCVLIDDFQRGSRSDRQWWQFAGLCKNQNIKLYCASDGFNLQDQNWEEMLHLYNLITQLEGKLRHKRGNRGHRGAAQRRRVSGKLSLGFARTPELDGDGNQVLKPDGTPFMVPCIDPDTRKYREKMYELFNEKKWSYYKIAQYYNRAKIIGWSGWTDVGIRSTLANTDAIGVFISNRTSSFKNFETGEWERKLNPRSEWDIYYDPSLAITSIAMWRATKRRIADISDQRGKRTGQAVRMASTLFSKALVCGYCGKGLTLARSAGGHKQLQCSNGRRRRHSCRLTTTKSNRIIENCILEYLKIAIINESNIANLLSKANCWLADEAAKPREDVGPLKRTLAGLQKDKDKLFARLSRTDDPDLNDAYDEQIASIERQMKRLRDDIGEMVARNLPTPPPLDLDCATRYVADMRGLLNQETPAAAEALHAITGPISITQNKKPGRKTGGAWIAKFSPDLVQFLRSLTKKNDSYPDSRTMEFLCRGKWIREKVHTVLLDQIPPRLSQAPVLAAKVQAGVTVEGLADSFGLTTERTQELVDYALHGVRPKSHKEKKARILREIQDDVVRLRDKENRSFSEIERRLVSEKNLQVPRSWVIEAWDNAHPEEIAAARAEGRRPRRGRFCHHTAETIRRIRGLLAAGRFNVAEIARLTGVCEMTVRRQRDMLDISEIAEERF